MRARTLIAAAVASLSGCVLITGSTTGYDLADAGGPCRSSTDCSSDAGPQACCVGINGPSIVGPACGPSPCPSPGAQLCATDVECKGSSCILQSCMFGATAPLQACGSIPDCTPIAATVADAGGADGGD